MRFNGNHKFDYERDIVLTYSESAGYQIKNSDFYLICRFEKKQEIIIVDRDWNEKQLKFNLG